MPEDYILMLFANIIKIYNNSIVKNVQDVQFPYLKIKNV